MKNKILIAILAVILIAGGIYAYKHSQNSCCSTKKECNKEMCKDKSKCDTTKCSNK